MSLIQTGQDFTISFQGPAVLNAKGMEAKLLADHMTGVAALLETISEEEVHVVVKDIKTVNDEFLITYCVRLGPVFPNDETLE